MSTPYEDIRRTKTKLRSRNQVTLPQEICDEAGAKAGDEFRVTVVRRARKVPAGSIVLAPEFFNTHSWTDKEWREKIREAQKSAAQGETHGPFDSAGEAVKFLKKESKRRRSSSDRAF
jgi:bifunctional DNA-binding transcriptional regulator/antitoxin component of YhaV-PrlF toxin-antitoxin module